MATLSKHGSEILRLEYCHATVSYRADGKVLRNTGDGWKTYKRVKPGVDIHDHCYRVAQNRAKKDEACPTFAKFRKILTRYGIRTRNLIYITLELMPTDPDGVWSTCDDHGIRVDLDDLVELSRLFDVAVKEAADYNSRVREQQRAAKSIGEPGLPNFNIIKP
jgi:hypothetical protein